MSHLWIIHRDAHVRATLGRLAGSAHPSVYGSPTDESFDVAEPPDVVLLGVSGDLEAELAFAARQLVRLESSGWILVHPPRSDRDQLERLFEGLGAEPLTYPPRREVLLTAISRAAASRGPDSLGSRLERAGLEERCARWLAGIALPEPSGAALQVLGEPGSGRLLLARMLHARAGAEAGALVHVACAPDTGLDAIARAARQAGSRATLCLEDADRLSLAVQRGLVSWIEAGAPGGRPHRLRWIALIDDDAAPLEPELQRALAGASLRLPPLRERPERIAGFVAATAREASARLGQVERRFSPEAVARLEQEPWPGNLRELEAVVVRSLASADADPLPPECLALERDEEPPVPAVVADEAGLADAAVPAEPASSGPPRKEHSASEASLERLVRSLAHELRNPLVVIRTFAALLPERYDDEEFRVSFREQVDHEVTRIETLLSRLSHVGELPPALREAVDVSALLTELLEERRVEFQRRKLVVLQELEQDEPHALGDPERLRFALALLLDKALAWMPAEADLYVASRHHPAGSRGPATLRVLLRFHNPEGRAAADIDPRATRDVSVGETAVEILLGERMIHDQAGQLTVSGEAGGETVILLDLPAA